MQGKRRTSYRQLDVLETAYDKSKPAMDKLKMCAGRVGNPCNPSKQIATTTAKHNNILILYKIPALDLALMISVDVGNDSSRAGGIYVVRVLSILVPKRKTGKEQSNIIHHPSWP